jgi:hypothetical protein
MTGWSLVDNCFIDIFMPKLNVAIKIIVIVSCTARNVPEYNGDQTTLLKRSNWTFVWQSQWWWTEGSIWSQPQNSEW